MKILYLLFIASISRAIKLDQYLDSTCSNLYQTYYFNLNECFSAGNGANAMNYTICNGTYFSANIYSGISCTGNPVLTMSGDPLLCGLERRIVNCNLQNNPQNIIVKSNASKQITNVILLLFPILLTIL